MEYLKYLSSFEEVYELVSKVQARRINNPEIMEHYRGQGRPEYKLMPNIARSCPSATVVQEKEAEIVSFLKTQLKLNEIENILYIDSELNETQNLWNILIQAQHLGLPTRLLDWSLKWQVGLWFAVENPSNDNVDGQFWIFSPPNEIHFTDTRGNFYDKDLNKLDQTFLINVPIFWSSDLEKQVGEIKRSRQFGKFTISPFEKSIIPLETQLNIIPYLEKYCIPAKSKKQIRNKLDSIGINSDWLYYRDANAAILNKLDVIMNKTSPK